MLRFVARNLTHPSLKKTPNLRFEWNADGQNICLYLLASFQETQAVATARKLLRASKPARCKIAAVLSEWLDISSSNEEQRAALKALLYS